MMTARPQLKVFLQAALADFVLVLVVCAALTFTVSYGFNALPWVRGNIVLDGLACVPMLVALYIGGWSKRSVWVSVAASVLVAVSILVVGAALMPAGVPLFVDGAINDVPENYVEFGFVVIAIPVLVYLLSRRPALCLVLIVAVMLSCGCVQFLYRDWADGLYGLPAFFAALSGSLALLVFQRFRSNARLVDRARWFSFASAAATSALVGVICSAVGLALFLLIINPIGLETPHLKLFQETYKPPVVEYTGIYSTLEVDDPDVKTSTLSSESTTTGENGPGGIAASEEEQDKDDAESTPQGLASVVMSAFSPDNWNETFRNISYRLVVAVALIALLVLAALIALAIALRRSMRRRRLKKLEGESWSYRVEYLTAFIESRLSLLGFEHEPDQTPLEYALANREPMEMFARDTGGVDFLKVTLLCQRSRFGGIDLGEDDYRAVERFYRAFFGNARDFVGKRRWVVLFWRI